MVNFNRDGPSSWNPHPAHRRTDRACTRARGKRPGISVIRNFSNGPPWGETESERRPDRACAGREHRSSRAHLLLPRRTFLGGGKVVWLSERATFGGVRVIFEPRVGRRRARARANLRPHCRSAWRPACTLRMNARPLNTFVSVRGARAT